MTGVQTCALPIYIHQTFSLLGCEVRVHHSLCSEAVCLPRCFVHPDAVMGYRPPAPRLSSVSLPLLTPSSLPACSRCCLRMRWWGPRPATWSAVRLPCGGVTHLPRDSGLVEKGAKTSQPSWESIEITCNSRLAKRRCPAGTHRCRYRPRLSSWGSRGAAWLPEAPPAALRPASAAAAREPAVAPRRPARWREGRF